MSFRKKPKTINPDEVDPSVYYYDEVYDDMKDEEFPHRVSKDDSVKTKQGSKYIQGIIETADRRKSEKEIRKFRKYARDREEAEANGDLDDTDVYVSKSYEKKLKDVQDVVKSKSKQDKDLELNSFKRHKRDDDQKASQVEAGPSSSKTQCDKYDGRGATGPATQKEQTLEGRKRPKTIEERREYLREVLKKQTVGDAFDAAVQRYKQRKASAS